jgi:hypothetical protein
MYVCGREIASQQLLWKYDIGIRFYETEKFRVLVDLLGD